MNDKDTSLENTGRCAYAAIAEMVAALQCDYDRLEELREERDGYEVGADDPDDDDAAESGTDKSTAVWAALNPDDAADLAELESAAGDCEDQDDARQRIEEDALSIEVRSDWQSMGETLEPAEFCILLTTGGPAVRIVGELNNGEPSRPRLQVQDWGTPWTDYSGEWMQEANNGFGANSVSTDVLLSYCSVFCFEGC